MNLAIRLLSAALVGGLLVPAFAGNGDPPADANKATAWKEPKSTGATAGECAWHWVVPSLPLKDDQTDDPAEATGWLGFGSTDAYAHTIADGMQIWAYGWAYDDRFDDSAGAAVSSTSIGRGRILATRKPEHCVAKVSADWSPRFRMRAHVRRGLGSAGAGGIMIGKIPQLNIDLAASLDVTVQTEPLVVESGGSYTIANIGGVSYSIARVFNVGKAPVQRDAIATDNQSAAVTSADVTYIGSGWVSLSADRLQEGSISESEAFLWDSAPNLEIEGKCLAECGGGLTVKY